jgi:hypothetical protein
LALVDVRFTPKADIDASASDVRFVPKAEVDRALFDYLVRDGEQA